MEDTLKEWDETLKMCCESGIGVCVAAATEQIVDI